MSLIVIILPILLLLLFNDDHTLVAKTFQLPTRGAIESPKNGGTLKGVTAVRGWFLDRAQVAKVDVFIDGHYRGRAKYGLKRYDVYNKNKIYKNRYSGYQFILDTRKLRTGQHRLTVRETGKNGKRTYRTQMIRVHNLPALGAIDYPKNNTTLQNVTTVSGWYVNGSGVAKVEVIVDGHPIGKAKYGLVRSDILKKFPSYRNRNLAFQYALDTRKLKTGRHSLTVKETAINGETSYRNINIYVHNLPSKGSIENPKTNSTVKDIISIHGWFLNGSGVSKVEAFVDNHIVGKANYGLLRADLKKAYPQYNNDHSGYEFNLNTYKLANGVHTLTLKQTAWNGDSSSISQKVFVDNLDSYTQVNLKKPAQLTAQDIRDFFDGSKATSSSPLKQYAQDFIDAQNKYGVNAQYLLAHAIWETGWGRSNIAFYKRNFYGYGAYDVAPFTSAYYFSTGFDSIGYAASKVRNNYLNVGGLYFSQTYGPTLKGMNETYATDQNWKNGIAALMQKIKPLDSEYYVRVPELKQQVLNLKTYGRDIPTSSPFPSNIKIDFPSGIKAIVNPPDKAGTTNLRSTPYLSTTTKIGTVNRNTEVDLYGYNSDVRYDPQGSDNYVYHWYRVKANGNYGWLYGQYLNIENLLQVKIPTGELAIYSSPSSSSRVLSSINNSSYLKAVMANNLLVLQNGWYKVYLPNSQQLGWVNNKSVTKIVH